MYKVKNFIDGAVTASSDSSYPIYNPAIGKQVGEVMFANKDEVQTCIYAAKNAFTEWSQTTPLKRARILFKFRELLEKNIDELAKLVMQEHGKILSDAKGSILRGIELVEFMCGIPNLLKGSYSQDVGTQVDSYTMRQPLGVCVGVTPFNFPVMVPIWMFVPAIACGNTFILKPSEKDPSAALRLAELMQQAGLPDGVLNVLQGDKTVVDQLIVDVNVQAVSCVGSSPVAKEIYQTAIKHGKRAHTFGGAKNHCVVMPDADLDEAAEAIAGAAFGSAGERCMALSVVVAVGDATANTLREKIAKKAAYLKIGAGDQADVEMGPLVTQAHYERVKQYINLGEQEGAELVIDGRKHEMVSAQSGFYMGASIFDHVKPTMRIYQEEIFGPVLSIVRVNNFTEALTLVNTHPYGNGTAIFTCNGETANAYARNVQVGMVGINVPIPVPVAYHVFGGWKESIFGDTYMHGEESVRFYTRSKTVTVRWPKNTNVDAAYTMPIH